MSEPMTPERLAEIRQLADQATAGPWGWRGHDDGGVELQTLHSGRLRVIGALRSDPCIVTLDDESLALAYMPCDACRTVYNEVGRTGNGDLFEGHRCEKPENLGTVWLWDKGFISPANQWAVREQPYRSDVARVDHPDAQFIAAAREVVPELANEVDRQADEIANLRLNLEGWQRTAAELTEALRRHVMDWGSCDAGPGCGCSHAQAVMLLVREGALDGDPTLPEHPRPAPHGQDEEPDDCEHCEGTGECQEAHPCGYDHSCAVCGGTSQAEGVVAQQESAPETSGTSAGSSPAHPHPDILALRKQAAAEGAQAIPALLAAIDQLVDERDEAVTAHDRDRADWLARRDPIERQFNAAHDALDVYGVTPSSEDAGLDERIAALGRDWDRLRATVLFEVAKLDAGRPLLGAEAKLIARTLRTAAGQEASDE